MPFLKVGDKPGDGLRHNLFRVAGFVKMERLGVINSFLSLFYHCFRSLVHFLEKVGIGAMANKFSTQETLSSLFVFLLQLPGCHRYPLDRQEQHDILHPSFFSNKIYST